MPWFLVVSVTLMVAPAAALLGAVKGETTKSVYADETVLIEKKGDKVELSIKGKVLKEDDAKELYRKFNKKDDEPLHEKVERETGIEPATSSLGSSRSTAELLPRAALRHSTVGRVLLDPPFSRE